jgi:hypothetical protein
MLRHANRRGVEIECTPLGLLVAGVLKAEWVGECKREYSGVAGGRKYVGGRAEASPQFKSCRGNGAGFALVLTDVLLEKPNRRLVT